MRCLIKRQMFQRIVFLNEGNGISPEILAMTDFNVYIPIAGVESLNVAIASAIILFHFKD